MAHGHPGDPAHGQCGAVALVVQDLLGGDLVVGEVFVGSERLGVHYWNRLENGEILDLTRAQFVEGETVTGVRTIRRPPGLPRHGAEAYSAFARDGGVLARGLRHLLHQRDVAAQRKLLPETGTGAWGPSRAACHVHLCA